MFDLGEGFWLLEMERWKRAIRLPPWIDSCACASGVCVLGVRGEGVMGIRPPAARVEKTELRFLTGVRTAGLAMTAKCSCWKTVRRLHAREKVGHCSYSRVFGDAAVGW